MKAKIIMYIEGKEYEYGTYHFNTTEERNKVNELAMHVREERGCYTYIEIMRGE
jgi:hypothetical protein